MVTAENLDTRPTLQMHRTFEAPRTLVWRAWSRPDILVAWIGPVDWPAFSVTCDFQVGGTWRTGLKSPKTDQVLWQGGTYLEIVEPERLVFTFKWEDGHEDGTPADTLVTVELNEPASGRTVMDFTQAGLKSENSLAGHKYGWNSTIDRLEAWLAANPD
jgi:uncharacterized protein YndB with AHSA1/START domain